jgi:Domain of unknown function (DUF4189)
MSVFLKEFGIIGIALALLSETTPVEAAGALAVGQCSRIGYTYGYPSVAAAQASALARCASNGDQTCRVMVTIRGACAAFAISGSCGARGWAYAPSRGLAEQLAINWCIREGGTECAVQQWICDGG